MTTLYRSWFCGFWIRTVKIHANTYFEKATSPRVALYDFRFPADASHQSIFFDRPVRLIGPTWIIRYLLMPSPDSIVWRISNFVLQRINYHQPTPTLLSVSFPVEEHRPFQTLSHPTSSSELYHTTRVDRFLPRKSQNHDLHPTTDNRPLLGVAGVLFSGIHVAQYRQQ